MIFRTAMLAAALAATFLGCRAEPQSTAVQPAAVARTAPSGLDLLPLQISSGQRTHAFTVEVARTPEEQSRGLMFRERLGPNEGMIFPFPSPRPASFWMKNVPIPLDIIFIRADGTIARIANAIPQSTDQVLSGEPVLTVLELAGGRSAQLGIAEGDRVTWPGGPAL